jgi:type VI secretion system protein ImpL
VKNLLKAVLRVLLWLIAAVLVCGGVYVACRLLDIPLKTGAGAVVLLFALILCLVFCLRAVSRRRRRLQIQRVVTMDADSLQDRPEKHLIANRWDRAISILRTSYLGGRGNPVYALPWYMVMGRSGSGKSSAISRCGLNVMLTDVGPEAEQASTRNCDWYFFKEAVVLDTAGRYALPLDEAADSADWREFLQNLAKYRRREALNGLVLTVAADALYGAGEHLIPEARALRHRLDEIMRVLGAKFPVYLMITKLDLLAGAFRLLEDLPAEQQALSLGSLIQSPDKKRLIPVSAQIDKALDDIRDKFRSLCLYSRGSSAEAVPHRILAWEELKAMMPALTAYAEELFAENPYQETPLLRGIFFSSALRTDAERQCRAFPGLSALVGGIAPARDNAGGFFLRDFFRRVLPADRNLNRPIAEYLRWRSSVRHLAYAALLLATFGLTALFSFSYRHNDMLLRQAIRPVTGPARDASAPSRLFAFEQLFRHAEQLDKEAGSGFLPSMGLGQYRKGLDYFYAAMNAEFFKDILFAANHRLEEQRSRLTDTSSDKDFFMLAADLVWRFDLLSAAREGKSFEDLLKIPAMPQGLLQALNVEDLPMLAPSAAYSMARYYYNGRLDADAQENELRIIRAALARLPEIKSYSMQWLIYRAGVLNNLPELKGSQFWPGTLTGALDEVRLEPAYTVEGFKVTLDYLERLDLIVSDESLKPHANNFLRWYADSYAEAWKNFSAAFTGKALELATVPSAEDVMTLMSSEDNPFFAFAVRMNEELRPVRSYLDPVPAWVEDLEVFVQALRLETDANQERLQPGLIQKLKQNVQQLYETAGSQLDPAAQQRHARAALLAGGIKEHLAALRELVRFTLSEDLAFTSVQEAMPDEKNQSAATAKLTLGKTTVLALQNKLDPTLAKDSPLLTLSGGPLAFFSARLVNSASCHIQSMWEGNVLAKAGMLPPVQLQQGLFAEQGGLARSFADNTLQYFLNHTLQGYMPEKLDETPIPFTDDFLHFLNAGLFEYTPMPQSHAVTMQAVPVDVNDGALEKPYAVVLSLDCSREKQELANYNSPASGRFNWQRGDCGDANIDIAFKSVALNVRYAGEDGFINFLHDFQYGVKTFYPSDFPGQEALLRKLEVTDIVVRYKISGAEAILRGVQYTPGTLPFVASECRR